ncbi:MAG: cyclic nucleotide-binding domain-containing protein [Mariprofundaceae bacterium]
METKFDEEPTLDFDNREFSALAVLFPDELHYLRSIATVLELAADVPVITEGQQARELYLVKSGLLMVNKRHGDEIYEVGSITPGEIFGEASILYDAPAGAEVRTTEPTVLYTIPAKDIRETLKTNERFERSLSQLAERRSAASALAVNPVFTTLPQAVREIALYNGRFLSLKEGETLIREGDTDTRFMYLVLGGEAEASMQHPKDPSKRIVFARISSGDEVGEISVITGRAHVATVTALTPLRLMMINNESVEAWRKRHSDFGYSLYACVQRKLQHSLEAIRNIVGEDMAKAITTDTLPPLSSKHHPGETNK